MTKFDEAFKEQIENKLDNFFFYSPLPTGPLTVLSVKKLEDLEGKFLLLKVPDENFGLPTLQKIEVKKKRKYTKRKKPDATVVKSADTLALGASSERSVGSSPISGTNEQFTVQQI